MKQRFIEIAQVLTYWDNGVVLHRHISANNSEHKQLFRELKSLYFSEKQMRFKGCNCGRGIQKMIYQLATHFGIEPKNIYDNDVLS